MESAYADDRFLDDVWAFFVSCFSLRDWLKNDNVASGAELRQLFASSMELRVCRDVANGAKHYKLTQSSTDGFAVGRQYKAPPFIMFTDSAAGDQLSDVLTVADACLERWTKFLESKKLH
jgi:hypothetical protein